MKYLAGRDNNRGSGTVKKPYLHKHDRDVATAPHGTKTKRAKEAEVSCIMLHCAVPKTAVHLSCLQSRARCPFLLAFDRHVTVCSAQALGYQTLSARNGRCLEFLWMPSITWWQMSGLLLDGITSSRYPVLRPTGYTSLLGRRRAQPHCTIHNPSCHTYSFTHTRADTRTHISAYISQTLLHQTAIIQATNGSHANAPRRIHSGNLKYPSSGCVYVCGCRLLGREENHLKAVEILRKVFWWPHCGFKFHRFWCSSWWKAQSIHILNIACRIGADLPFWSAGRLDHRRHAISVQALGLGEVDDVENHPLKDKHSNL